jgi:hypothetical protein
MGAHLRIYSRTRKTLLTSEGRAALNLWSRLRGLLGGPPLYSGRGLLIAPCNWIRTLGMGFAIDVLYLHLAGQVPRMVSEMRPNRIGASVWRASSVVESPVGASGHSGTRAGDWLETTCTPDGKGSGL